MVSVWVRVWVVGGCRCRLASGHPQVHPCMLCRSWRNRATQRWKNRGIVNTAERHFQDQGTHIIFLFQVRIYAPIAMLGCWSPTCHHRINSRSSYTYVMVSCLTVTSTIVYERVAPILQEGELRVMHICTLEYCSYY